MMKEIVPPPPPIVRNQFEVVRALFNQNVVPSYGRFDLVLSHAAPVMYLTLRANATSTLAAASRFAASATHIQPSPKRS